MLSNYVRVSFVIEIPGPEDLEITKQIADNYAVGNSIIINDARTPARIPCTIRSILCRKANQRDVDNIEEEKPAPGERPSKKRR